MIKELNGLPVEELFLSDCFAMGLVTNAANERNDIMLFSNTPEDTIYFKTVNNEERVVTGIAMVPEIPIFRPNPSRYVWFSKETIKSASLMFFKNHNQNNTTLEHQVNLQGNTVFESWIVTDPELDKTKLLGFKDVKPGSWAISMKIEDDIIWDKYLKTGIIKGFSVEAKRDKTKESNKMKLNLKNILNFFSGKEVEEFLAETTDAVMESTMLVLEFVTNDGRTITLDETLIAKYIDDGSLVPEGKISVKPINDETASWELEINSEGKVLNFRTPWSEITDSTVTETETTTVEDLTPTEDLSKIEEELKMSKEIELNKLEEELKMSKQVESSLLVELEALKVEIEQMKVQVNPAIVVKAGQDKYTIAKDQAQLQPDLANILKTIDAKTKK